MSDVELPCGHWGQPTEDCWCDTCERICPGCESRVVETLCEDFCWPCLRKALLRAESGPFGRRQPEYDKYRFDI